MTTLKEQMSADLSDVFFNTEEFADEAVYTPQSGDAVTVPFIEESQDPGIMKNITPGDEMVILIMDPDTAPGKGDTFEIDGQTWHLSKILKKTAGTHLLKLSRSEWRAPGSGWRST